MKAGFGVCDITPRVGVQLYGFGPFLNRQSIAVRDPLDARAAAFQLGDKTALIISCDICTLKIPTVKLIKEIIRETHPELTDADILICATHTHSGPATTPGDFGWGVTDPVYLEILPYKIARAGLNALANLEEVEVATGTAPCEHIGLNRVHDKDAPPLADVLDENWRPAKPELTDTECRVITFSSKNGELKGLLTYFGCHPVVCCQQTRYIHGDYPGVATHNLMRQFPGSVALFLQGAEGDVNSCVVHKPEQESLLALDIIAGRFERSVRRAMANAEPVAIDTLETLLIEVDFSTRQSFTREYLLELKKEQENILHSADADETSHQARMATVYLCGIRKMLEDMDSGMEPVITGPVHGIRLGPIEFLGAPFEIMQVIKNETVAAAKAPIPLVMSLSDGALGYAQDKYRDSVDTYEARMVPLIQGRLPYGKIHDELLDAFTKIDKILFKG